MPIVAKRKLTETWREAVARRARECGREEACLQAFDARRAAGAPEAEAAYRSLAEADCLSDVPDGPAPGRREAL